MNSALSGGIHMTGTHQHLNRIGSGSTALFEKCMKILELLHRLLDQKLGNFHEERMHSYKKYSVEITTEKKNVIGRTWNGMNPAPEKTSKSFVIYAAALRS